MECLQIDWKNIDHSFVRDEFYESIQAPKWIDFTAPLQPADDHEWFCAKFGCIHESKMEFQDILGDSIFLDRNEVVSLSEKTILGDSKAAAKRKGRTVMSSSVSSVIDMKQNFVKSKFLQQSKVTAVEGNKKKPAIKKQHASENENPNKAVNAQVAAHSKAPMSKIGAEASKKMKTAENASNALTNNREAGALRPLKASSFRKLPNEVASSKAAMEVNKSTTIVVGKTESLLHERTAINARFNIGMKESVSRSLDIKTKKEEATRPPFAVSKHPIWRGCVGKTASSAASVKRQDNPAIRSMHNIQFVKPSIQCRPPKVIARKNSVASAPPHRHLSEKKNEVAQKEAEPLGASGQDNTVVVSSLQTEEVTVNDAEILAEAAQFVHQHQALSEQSACDNGALQAGASDHDIVDHSQTSSQCCNEKICSNVESQSDDLEHGTTVHCQNLEDDTLERSLMNLHLGASEEHESFNISHGVSTVSTEENAHMHETAEISSQSITTSQVDCNIIIHRAKEIDRKRECSVNAEKLQMMKHRQLIQGKKRKSSELNFKVNCYSKDHKSKSLKVLAPNKPPHATSLSCHQLHMPARKLAAANCSLDSCKEQHKRLKTATTLPQVKPFRFRTEERIALKELSHQEKEVPNQKATQDLGHHALRMPSFGRPFRPQRSTKKLTIPKEPNFHQSKIRKACTKQTAT